MPNLPPRFNQRPNTLPRFLLSLITLFIMLAALPIGVYLVGQRTHVLSEAATPIVPRTGTVSFTLEKDPQFATTSAQIEIDLLAHSDDQAANLFATRVSFPNQDLELVNVATSSADLQSAGQAPLVNKWIESNIDNQDGQVDLIAGVPTPGIKTDLDQRYIMAKLIFNVRAQAEATFHLDPDSAIFSNSTNMLLETRKNDLTLELPPIATTSASPSPSPKKQLVLSKPVSSSLNLISPQGGETVPFNDVSSINWNASGIDQVSINLLINGDKLGRIASASASLGQINWRPADFILPTFLASLNTYQIEIEGTDNKGQLLSAQSAGPFAITNQDINLEASQAANLAQRGGDANKDGKVDLTDLSILLSSFGKTQNIDLGTDLNGDGVVNDVDLWLFKGVLLR